MDKSSQNIIAKNEEFYINLVPKIFIIFFQNGLSLKISPNGNIFL